MGGGPMLVSRSRIVTPMLGVRRRTGTWCRVCVMGCPMSSGSGRGTGTVPGWLEGPALYSNGAGLVGKASDVMPDKVVIPGVAPPAPAGLAANWW